MNIPGLTHQFSAAYIEQEFNLFVQENPNMIRSEEEANILAGAFDEGMQRAKSPRRDALQDATPVALYSKDTHGDL